MDETSIFGGDRLCEVARSDIYIYMYIIYDILDCCVKNHQSHIYTLVKTNGRNLTLEYKKTTSCSHFVPSGNL